MPRRAERRPAREVPPERRIRAAAPAQAKPECWSAVAFFDFETLIESLSPEISGRPARQGES
jgi:hypothetical protein